MLEKLSILSHIVYRDKIFVETGLFMGRMDREKESREKYERRKSKERTAVFIWIY